MKNININELLLLNNPNIIDIRSHYSFINGHIPGSINIPSYLLLKNSNMYLDKNKTYYIYCNSGSTSRRVVYELDRLGYNTINISGGYNSYLIGR